ncbi:MAG TPA: AMP-binding protein [Arenicellales bacterium]|nr:AMP-binding protein [Arenicellales bacterium]
MTLACGHRTLASLWRTRVAMSGERPFLIFDDLDGGIRRYTYGEFDQLIHRTAGLLLELGVGRGDRISLHLANSVEFLALWFAAARIGAVIMPTNTAATVDELEYLVGHSGCRIIFTQAPYESDAEQVAARCDGVERIVICGAGSAGHATFDGLLAEASAPASLPDVEPTDDAAILYTSGTTARPKGVQVTHANYIYAGETVAKAIRLAPDDRHLTVLPLFHGNAQYYSTMSALVSGASMVLCGRFSASRYFATAARHQCTVASLFAAPIRMLLAQPRDEAARDNHLRVVIFAQSITPEQERDWEDRFGAPLLQLWGMTETMGTPLMNPVDYERRNQSIGLPAMGYEVGLVDESGEPIEGADRTGEIVVRGLPGWSLMKGYYRNPEATAETIRGEWLRTGDNARRDADGYFHFVDRAKDMIKRSGENVAASEVESVIMQHPAVFDCAVIGVPDEIRDEKIKAVVVLKEGEQADAESLQAWCAERLARFRVPEIYEFRDSLPRTSVGKIQKHILRRES